jgi:hypothetical protein
MGNRAAADGAVESASGALTDEERIESAKYLPRQAIFEEDRFVFPETYGLNRARLIVKDPETVFTHWDVDPGHIVALRGSLGARVAALAQLTLRVKDTTTGQVATLLLPPGARSWYLRTDGVARSYRAQLGLTLPSGDFRLLAESNTATLPRVGPSPVAATRVVSYARAAALAAEAIAMEPPSVPSTSDSWPAGRPAAEESLGERGGASDIFRL